jgi:hypothetical protein
LFARKYFDGVKYTDNETIIFDPKNIVTKSQLTDIWNKTNGTKT